MPLIVIQQDMDLTIYEHTGEMFNADVNARLIRIYSLRTARCMMVAMIIADNRIKAAGCILPVAQNATLPRIWDCAIVPGWGCHWRQMRWLCVSEERGKISVAHKGKLSVNVTAEELQQILSGEREVTNYC